MSAVDSKYAQLSSLLPTLGVDILNIQEVNLHFTRLGPNSQWSHRMKNCGSFSHCATNQHSQCRDKKLFGGTALVMNQRSSCRSAQHGKDPSGLGRWSWSLLTGRQNITVRVISLYRPAVDATNRPYSTAAQHKLHFAPFIRDPRVAILEDLDREMVKWLEQGDKIILCGDFNEDVRSQNLKHWREKWMLVDAHQEKHPSLPPVATYNRNTRNVPIDAIWVSSGLEIQAAGYLGFGEYKLRTDHRILWMDIKDEELLGYRAPPPPSRPPRSLPLNDPTVIRKRNRYVQQERQRHRIDSKIFDLEQKALAGTFTPSDALAYDRLARQDDQIQVAAVKRARKFFTGRVLYSDVIGALDDEKHLWQLVVEYRKSVRTDTRKIRRLMVSTNNPTALRLSLEEAEAKRAECHSRYLVAKKNDQQHQAAFHRKVAERRAIVNNSSPDVEEKKLRLNAAQAATHRTIRRVHPKKERVALTHCTFQTDSGQAVSCYTRVDIEAACVAEGQKRFSQTDGTPPTRGSLSRDLGFLATQATVDLILTGEYVYSDDVDAPTRAFLDELVRPDTVPIGNITGFADTPEHRSSWKKMRAQTASSPFGPLFTDLIAGAHSPSVADVDASFSSIPVLTGFCPAKWKKAVDVMIPKKKDSVDVSKLRIIVLFHTMFNMLNKRVGRAMVHQANSHGLLPREAYGSVPGGRSITCAWNKTLTADLARLQAQTMALCSNDAKSCYDRIVHAIAVICMQRMGVSAQTCSLMLGTLQELEHYVATEFGTSSSGYGAIRFPLQGVGQGNGAGPAIWLVMSIPLINMLKKKGFGFTSWIPSEPQPYSIACFTFVDDTDLIQCVIHRDTHSYLQVIHNLQQSLDLWEGGLRATGGQLVTNKSYWYLLDFEWVPSALKFRYRKIAACPGQLTIHANTDSRHALKRCEASHAEETLGVWIAMDGNQDVQVSVLLDKVTRWSDKARTRQLNPLYAWTSLRSGLSRSLRYPLLACRLTENQCKIITRPLVRAALPAMGIPRNMPLAVVFAPKEYLGLGFPHVWVDQNVDQITGCLTHGSRGNSDHTSCLLRDIFQRVRLQIGVPKSPLYYPFSRFRRCCETTFLNTLWTFCNFHSLVLDDGSPDIPLPRSLDQPLMIAFEAAGYTDRQLQQLNLCRRFLNIFHLSDLTTGDGCFLLESLLEARQDPGARPDLADPNLPRPPNSCWTLWHSAVRETFLLDRNDRHLRLMQPLGSWLNLPSRHPWYLDPHHHVLYHLAQPGEYQVYRRLPQSRSHRQPRYSPASETVSTLPVTALPTITYGRSHTIRFASGVSALHPSTANNWDWWLRVVSPPSDLSALLEGIQLGTAVAVTDGSYRDQVGAAAYILKSSIGAEDTFVLGNVTPGSPGDMNAYRAEYGGLYGCVLLVTHLARTNFLSHGHVTLGCDCLSALQSLFRDSFPSPRTPHFDMVTGCRRAMDTSRHAGINWTPRHIEAHQDDNVAYSSLDPWARLNVDMDSLAKRILNSIGPLQPWRSLPPTPGEWSISVDGVRLSKWDDSIAHQIVFNKQANGYWSKKLAVDDCLRRLDFGAICLAYRSLQDSRKLFVPKWITGFIATGSRLSRWFPDTTTHVCPACGADHESRNHVLRCRHNTSEGLWDAWLESLDTWLRTSYTQPDLRLGLLSYLDAWHSTRPWQPPPSDDADVLLTFAAQSALSPDLAVLGFFVPNWAEVQQRYYQWLGRRATGKRWLSRLIAKLWEISWDMWRHRCGILHSSASATIPARHLQLNTQVRLTYGRLPDPTPPHLLPYTTTTLSEILDNTVVFKEEWLRLIHAFLPPVVPVPTPAPAP